MRIAFASAGSFSTASTVARGHRRAARSAYRPRTRASVNHTRRNTLVRDLVELKIDQPVRCERRAKNASITGRDSVNEVVAERITAIQNLRKEILNVTNHGPFPKLPHCFRNTAGHRSS